MVSGIRAVLAHVSISNKTDYFSCVPHISQPFVRRVLSNCTTVNKTLIIGKLVKVSGYLYVHFDGYHMLSELLLLMKGGFPNNNNNTTGLLTFPFRTLQGCLLLYVAGDDSLNRAINRQQTAWWVNFL